MMNEYSDYRLKHRVISDSIIDCFNFCEQKYEENFDESLTWQERPWARDEDIKKEVQDPLEQVNLGSEGESRFTYISAKLSTSEKKDIIGLSLYYKNIEIALHGNIMRCPALIPR